MSLISLHPELTKVERNRFAKAEMWLQLACTAQRWADYGIKPGDPDPLGDVAFKYDLTSDDMRRLLTSIAEQLERKALASGYDEAPL